MAVSPGPAESSGGLVVELSVDDVAGSYCARTLRSLGRRVVKIEPPGGDPLRFAPPLLRRGAPGESSGLFQYLNAGKESLVADISAPAGWEEIELFAANADIVILSVAGDAEMVDARQRHLAAINPSSVRIVLSPYGLTGPYRNLPGSDITDWAASGYMFVTGEPQREPLAGGGPFPAYTAGLTAAIGALAAWRDARNGGPGRLVDVSVMESMAALHQWTLTQYTYLGHIKRRVGNRHGDFHHPVAFLECSDGWVCIAAAGEVQWQRLSEAVDLPELLADTRFQSSGERFDHADEVDAALRPWLLSHTREEVAAILQDHRVPAAVVTDVVHMLEDRQLRSRGFFQTIAVGGAQLDMPGSPLLLGEPVTWTAAPQLGAHSARALSETSASRTAHSVPPRATVERRRTGDWRVMTLLDGVRVLDLTRAWAGPLAGRTLADLGAEVIHIEYARARGAGVVGKAGFDMTASPDWEWGELPEPSIRAGLFPDANPGPDPWNRQASFNKLNRSKKSLCLDLHEPEGQEIFRGLVAVSDVVLENYSPRGARGLGVVFDMLRDVNPRIVVVSISGYGHTGPDHDRVALGPIVEAESGLAALTGYRKGGPTKLGAAMPDAISGLNGALGTIAALARRDTTGQGSHVDVAMLEAFAAIGGEAFLVASDSGVAPERHGNRSWRWAPQGVYRCAGDDEWIALTVRSTAEWRRLVELLDAPPLRHGRFADSTVRTREQPYLDRIIESWTTAQTKWGAWRRLRDRDLVAFPVMTNADLVHDEQLNARGFMVEWDQPGIGPRRYPGVPIRFDPPLDHEVRPAALLGQHNRPILRDLLGYDDAAIDKLESTGVIATEPPR